MKRLFAIILLSVLLCASLFAYDFSAVCESGQTLYYNITSDVEPYTVKITTEQVFLPDEVGGGYDTYPTGDLVLPSSVTYNGIEYTVSSIGYCAFCVCDGLTSVSIPNSVTSIADYAFSGCYGLLSLTIPNSVTSIGTDAFWGVKNIVYNGNVSGSPWGALTTNGFVEGYLVYSDDTRTNLTGCSTLATEVTIPNSVTHIGEYSFAYCGELASVEIPNTTTEIGRYAFELCKGLTSITIPNSVVEIGSWAFGWCSGLTEVTIPNSVRIIGSYIFSGCSGLSSVTIPNSAVEIGNGAFSGCSGLTSVTFPNSVTVIDSYAFDGCTSLISLTIPNSVTSIGNNAFRDVRNIVYNGTATGSPWGALIVNGFVDGYLVYSDNTKTNLTGCSSLATEIEIPNSVLNIGNNAFSKCRNLSSISIPNSVTNISDYAFFECSNLSTATIGFSVTNIGRYAFCECRNLASVYYNGDVAGWCGITFDSSYDYSNPLTYAHNLYINNELVTDLIIPETVTEIKPYAFQYATCITSLTIGNSVANIGDYAFAGCYDLTGNLTIPNSVRNIGGEAFFKCTQLNFLTIGSSVESISWNAFAGCNNIDTIYSLATNPPTITILTFDGIASSIPIIVPCGRVSAYRNAGYWRDFTNIQENCSGVDENEIADLQIYPNPVSNTLNISSSEGISEIEIVNMMGQVVLQMAVDSKSAVCDVENLPSGVYVVKVCLSNGEAVVQRKFIKE
ncbi:MAG: leucine-rich repeat protein [Bacteroidales bacterium]|nr:leucine-rich repeat protein [Bacteroidales bacterium]